MSNMKSGYMAFLVDAPMVGLDPHPAYAPQDNITRFDAGGYFEALGAEVDKGVLEKMLAEDTQAQEQAVANGDLEDMGEPDIIFDVDVYDDGMVEIFYRHIEGGEVVSRDLLRRYSVAQVYDTFGMTMPHKP